MDETSHEAHKTLSDLRKNYETCPQCRAVVAAQRTAITDYIASHRIDIEKFATVSQEVVKALTASIQRIVEPIVPRIPEFLRIVDESLRGFRELMARSVMLGQWGWLVPDEASLSDFAEIVGRATDPESADHAFTGFYSEPRNFDELRRSVLTNVNLLTWMPLLEEVFFSMEARHYRICVPALLATFEGIADAEWVPEFRKVGVRKTFFRDQITRHQPDSVEFFEWTSVAAFVDTMYQQASPRRQRPVRLNRHWILHGRGVPDSNLSDCLRLLLAVRIASDLRERTGE